MSRPNLHVKKEPDDPECLRASIGGRADEGYYIVFRGDLKEVKKMLYDVICELDNYKT